MILTVVLQPGTVLANVLYEWYAAGSTTPATSAGVTQPDTRFSVFRIDSIPPAGAEELAAWDSSNLDNWNVASYRAGLSALASASQILLTAPYVPSGGPSTIIPGSPAASSICRCYGTWYDISALTVNGEPMTLTLVAQDNTTPSLLYDLSATPLKNTETGLIVAQRVISTMLIAGQLENVNQDPYVDLNRTDYISGAPPGTTLLYLLTSVVLGAPMTLQLINSATPVVFKPVLFALTTATIGVATGGTYDISKKAV